MTIRAFLRSLSFVAFMLVFAAPGFAADISAEMTALMSDVLKPYRTGTNLPSDANTDPKAVNAALEILKKENLLDIPRPATGVTDIVERFGKALALGTRSQQFQTEIGTIYDAITKGDERAAKDAIRKLYEKAGRKPPEGESLEKFYKDVLSVHGAEPQETERVEIKRPDYSVDLILARAAGKMKVEVSGQNGPDGKPFRTLFEGDVVTRPDPSGKGLELVANPASAPLTMTTEQAQMLREKLNGTWTDEKGNTWEISGGGNSITLTESYQNGHKVVYNGQYNLAKVTGEHIINDPLDMEGLPEQVSQQVASNFKTPYRIALDFANGEGNCLAVLVSYHLFLIPLVGD